MLMHPKPPDEVDCKDSVDRGSSNPGEAKSTEGGKSAENGEKTDPAAAGASGGDLMATETNLIQL